MKNQNQNIFLLVIIFMFVLIGNLSFVFAQADTNTIAPNADTKSVPPPADIKVVAPPADIRTVAPSGIFTLQNPLRSDINSVGGLVQAFIEIVTYLAIIFAVLAFIWVGFQYVTSAATGNQSKIKELHDRFMWLVIGVAVIIAARVIIQVVINTISATGTVSPTVIQSANNALQGK